MQLISIETPFPLKSPGGNLKEWKDAEINIYIQFSGIYIIEVNATTESGEQNGTGDDDDLRMTLDGYVFGKEEINNDNKLWKGFGVAASWNGASLKGSPKTVYFIVYLDIGKHDIKFIVDNYPVINKFNLYKLDQKDDKVVEDIIFSLNEIAPGIHTDEKGIPWKAFVFQSKFNSDPFRIKLVDITALCLSGKQKKSTDGDNIKIYANGEIITNIEAPTSRKYKNFCLSGDQLEAFPQSIMIPGDQFIYSNSGDFSIEIYYDQTPTLLKVQIEIESGAEYDRGNTIERWTSHVSEFFKLQAELMLKFRLIRNIVGQSWTLQREYALEKGFYSLNEQGDKIIQTSDNEVDAYRHFIWNVLLAKEFGKNSAEIIAYNHELFWNAKSGKNELSRANYMDLWNNIIGREYFEKHQYKKLEELFELALRNGDIITSLEQIDQEIKNKIQKDLDKFLGQ